MRAAAVLCCLCAALAAAAVEPLSAALVSRRDQDRAIAAHLLAAYVFVAGGSGVVVDPSGVVLTNHHVIDGESKLEARFANGATYPARVLGTDPVGDIAVLKIDAPKELPFVQLAPADALKVGADVIAVGNPFGLGDFDSTPSLSRGVLSAARLVRDDYTDALQLDAPVNPGNSGGPSFDLAGRLLGINGQIRTVSGMRINSGVGLAIASTQLAAFLPLLAKADGGYVHHTARPKDLELEQRHDGVYVNAAGGTKLVVDDQLLTIAGRPVRSKEAAEGLFESLPWTPGRTISMTVDRDDKVVSLEVVVIRKPIPGKPYHGISVEQKDDTEHQTSALEIEEVDDDSPAKRAGIQAHDVLLTANGKPMARKLDLLKVMVKLEVGDWLELTLRTAEGAQRSVKLLLRQRE